MNTVNLSAQGIHEGNLILVNRNYPYFETEEKERLIPVTEGTEIVMRRAAAALLSGLMADMHGWDAIVPVSGWRSRREQQEIWDASLAESGKDFTEKYVAAPGHSEHQTGLAIDLGKRQADIDFICPDFPYTGICQTFREKAASYGFVERYPAGKENVTGIGHEPWHFRYVGVPHALIMTECGMVLEEYTEFVKQYIYGRNPYRYRTNETVIEISYLKAETGHTVEWNEDCPRTVSGNNVDGYVITEWRGGA